MKVDVEQQHRAIHDAKTTTNVFMKMLGDIAELGITNYKDLNTHELAYKVLEIVNEHYPNEEKVNIEEEN